MAQFVAKNSSVEVHKRAIQALAFAFEVGIETRMDILKRKNVDLNKPIEWFIQQDYLNAFSEISEKMGSNNIFMIGKAVVNNVPFPPMINLEEALRTIDIAYHMNHRLDGKIMYDVFTKKKISGIGNYKLTMFDEKERKAEMVCNTPYPSDFDRGIITQVVRKFKPQNGRDSVTLDNTKETRSNLGETCTYIITW